MVPPRGIEPRSSVLQTGAMTTSAKAAINIPMNYYYRINYHNPVFNDIIDLNTLKNNKLKLYNTWENYYVRTSKFVSKDALSFLQSIGLKPKPMCYFFVGKPFTKSYIHLDHYKNHVSYAFNYAWGSDDSVMKWYKFNDQNFCPVESKQIIFKPEDVTEVEQFKFSSNLFLVKIDSPHSVENNSNSTRYCISIRCEPYISWEEITLRLQDYFI